MIAATIHYEASCARVGGTGFAFFALGPAVGVPQAIVLLIADRRLSVGMWALLTSVGGMLSYLVGTFAFLLSEALAGMFMDRGPVSLVGSLMSGACAGATIGALQIGTGPDAPQGRPWLLASALGGAALAVFASATFLGNCGPVESFGLSLPLLAWGLIGALVYGGSTAFVLVRAGP